MKMHAESQIDATEAVRLMMAALTSSDCRGRRLVQATGISTQEMLGHWSTETPEGALHRVALVRVLDGEVLGFEGHYLDVSDALAVWQHIYGEAVENGTATAPQAASDPR